MKIEMKELVVISRNRLTKIESINIANKLKEKEESDRQKKIETENGKSAGWGDAAESGLEGAGEEEVIGCVGVPYSSCDESF